jgi:SAM-dependent methyltransferase
LIDPLSTSELQNRNAYNRMAKAGHILAQPVTPEELKRPLEVVDGRGWLGGCIRGWRVLCLAAGGGRHSALYSAAGADVTVVDISEGMLELDREICEHYRFNARLIQASMLSMPMLKDEEFDLVIHPVSTCYVSHLQPVFDEVARVLRPGGLYVSQHKSPFSLQCSLLTDRGKYWVETELNSTAKPVPHGQRSPLRETDSTEISHSLETILGGICRAGMIIEDLTEPDHVKTDAEINSSGHRAKFIRPYLRVKARRVSQKKMSGLILP